MICHEFKGGIGTASRGVDVDERDGYTVGVLVQANYGMRAELRIAGVPVGAADRDDRAAAATAEDDAARSSSWSRPTRRSCRTS